MSDPVKNCPVYKSLGCAHVDGYLCDYPNCSIVEKYLNKENKIRVYGWVWKNKRHEDECHYVPCYTPGNHIERGEMLALVDPKDLPDYYTEWHSI